MTPLARLFMKELCKPIKRRHRFVREHGDYLRHIMSDIHCFEVTEVHDLAIDIATTLLQQRGDAGREAFDRLMFLPAPRTWLEYHIPGDGFRTGVLLTEPVSEWDDDSFTLHLFHANRGQDFLFAGRYALVTPARGELGAPGERICSWDARHAHPWVTAYWEKQNKGGAEFDGVISDVVGVTVSLLALINSPRIIGRQQHMPSRVLEQKLTRGFGVGKFPLHAWTEIKLEVAKPIEIDDGEPHEAHLTGRRALHFVRKHLRLWNGELIYVTSHWRGDPALGIKQSRYRVVRDANRNDGNNRTT